MFRRRVEKGKDDPVVQAFIDTKRRICEKYYLTKLHVSSLRFLIENPTRRFFSSFFLLFSLLLTFQKFKSSNPGRVAKIAKTKERRGLQDRDAEEVAQRHEGIPCLGQPRSNGLSF